MHAAVIRACVSGAAALALSGVASAQVITDGNSSFNMPVAGTSGAANRTGTGGGAASALTAGGDTTDQLFQQWWWYRVNGVNAREFAFSGRTSNVAAGNTLTLGYTEPEGFDASLVYRLTDGPDSPASCVVDAQMTLRTTSTTPLSMAVFSYIDYDLEGVGTDGAVSVSGTNHVRVTDSPTGFFGEIFAPGANAYQIAAFATVRGFLTDADVDNLASTGLPFTPADFTGAWQWNITLVQNQPVTLRFIFTLNTPADPCAGLPVGDLDGDHDVDLTDLATLLTHFGMPSGATLADGDIDHDGDVDLTDLATLLTSFGSSCP